jgi:hypothetical protein
VLFHSLFLEALVKSNYGTFKQSYYTHNPLGVLIPVSWNGNSNMTRKVV